MQLILENPYRIIGILVGTSLKDQTRQISRLKQYLDADQEPPEAFSFPKIGKLNRSLSSVTNAISNINLDHDKLTYSLFWFYNGNDITDEPAFNFIKEGNINEAVAIWAKLTNGKNVSEKNASAFFNLSTLMLNSALDTLVKEDLLERAVKMRLKFLESDFYDTIKKLSTDENFKISKREIQLLFLNELKSQLRKVGSFSSDKLTSILTSTNFIAKEEFLKGQTDEPIQNIEKKIDNTRKKRLANKSQANVFGKELYSQVIESLNQLKIILNGNLKYSTISDKVSDEILQCGIDYFMHYRDSSTDPSASTIELFKISRSLAIGNIAIQRWSENSTELNDWIKEKPERDKIKRINGDLERLKVLMDNYEQKAETVLNAKLYLSSALPYLNNIKNVYGAYDDFYLSLCSRIASDAQGMCVSEINKIQDTISNTYDQVTKIATMMVLKQKVNEAWDVTTTIGGMDLKSDFRTRYNTNRTSLSSLKAQLVNVTPINNFNRPSTSYSKPKSTSNSGCYIATMAYGNYDHPQVLILRKFRDEVLQPSYCGRLFIKYYYYYSPKLVLRLKDKKRVNYILRRLLNLFIGLIK